MLTWVRIHIVYLRRQKSSTWSIVRQHSSTCIRQQRAAHEIVRVLKMMAKAFICAPFLQPYYGYPHHYQNYTLPDISSYLNRGQRVEAGPCLGPCTRSYKWEATFIRHFGHLVSNARRPSVLGAQADAKSLHAEWHGYSRRSPGATPLLKK